MTLKSINNHHELIAAQTPSWFHFTSGVVLLTTTLISLISNGSVVFALLIKNRTLLTRITTYIITICCLNLLMAAFGTPMVVMSCFNKVWLFGELGCTYYAFLMTFGGLTSMLLLTLISVDRYIYVVRHNLSKHLSTMTVIISITVSCLITLGLTISPFFGWNQYTYEGVGTSCAIDLVGENNNGQSFVLTICAIYFAVPVFSMLFAYGSIYAKVSRDYKAKLGYSRRKDSVSKRKEFRKKLSIEQELAVTLTIIIGFFLICYTPYTIVLLWQVLSKNSEMDPIAMAIPAMITKIAGIFTPFVYLSKNKIFREHMLNVYPCFKSRNRVHPCENIEQPAVTNVNTIDERVSANHLETKQGNSSKQRDNRKCSLIKKKTTKIDETGTLMISDVHSTVAVYTVDKSDIYDNRRELSFSQNIRKPSVDIADTSETENVIEKSDGSKNVTFGDI
ncbi:rhodopsin-like [Mytilus trossulus]|uniref:rhodopsin-like n=1 Tax=Mytilus trossulus TaxID=6551 RepID=UPI003004C8C0